MDTSKRALASIAWAQKRISSTERWEMESRIVYRIRHWIIHHTKKPSLIACFIFLATGEDKSLIKQLLGERHHFSCFFPSPSTALLIVNTYPGKKRLQETKINSHSFGLKSDHKKSKSSKIWYSRIWSHPTRAKRIGPQPTSVIPKQQYQKSVHLARLMRPQIGS